MCEPAAAIPDGVRDNHVMSPAVSLRPIGQADLPIVSRLLWDRDATGEFQWFGFRMGAVRNLERRWREDGLEGKDPSYLAVALADGSCIGWVTWRRVGPAGALEVGIALLPEHRGRGLGTEAQRQLVDYLFRTTTVHRIQAGTEVDNVAEQRALERVGFQREGVQRALYFRDGAWRDSVMYGLLRVDARPFPSLRQ
jgi:RimJ/RimL family protein N-acetyltransferase